MTARLPFRDAYMGPPIPLHTPLPTLRLPRDRHQLPKACSRCGGHLFDVDEDRSKTIACRWVCLLCGTQAAWVQWER